MDGEGTVVDELCPMAPTVLKQELKMKAKILNKLLEKIDKGRLLREKSI
jgi:hypothetical protein